MNETLLTIPRNGGEELRVSMNEYKGHRFLSLRVWFNAGGGEMKPGKQGCTVPLSGIPQMQKALERAAELAQTDTN